MSTMQAAGKTAQKQITLNGSAQIVTEFFDLSLNSILFQRGLYPPEDFKMVKKYGLNLLVTCDDAVQAYLSEILAQVQVWLAQAAISKLVLVLSSKDSRRVLERWQFDVRMEPKPTVRGNDENAPHGRPAAGPPLKTDKEIQTDIAAIMRQITASVSFLPILDEPCSFTVLAYTTLDSEAPMEWVPSDARAIGKNAEQVKLRSFSTSRHKVEALVAYRLGDAE